MFLFFFKFDTVKEILKIRYQIYILMKKMIILRKIQFEPEQKKTCGNERQFMLQLLIYYILE